jgi:hypothetical protein
VLIPLGLWIALNLGPPRRQSDCPVVGHHHRRRRPDQSGRGNPWDRGRIDFGPILISTGYSPKEVAPATLAATWLTSPVGVATFIFLSPHHGGSIAPAWGIGVALGAGGRIGSYLGARVQPPLPEQVIRRTLGVIVTAIGIR